MEAAFNPHRVIWLAIRDCAQDLVGRQRGRVTRKWADKRQISGTSRNRTPAIIEGPTCAAHDNERIWCDALQNEGGSFQVVSQDVPKGHPFCLITAIPKDYDSVYLQGYCKSDV